MTKNSNIHIKDWRYSSSNCWKSKRLYWNCKFNNQKKSIVFIDGIVPRIKYSKNPQGGEQKKEELQIPIHISNVMLWDKENNSASRINYKIVDGKKQRCFVKSGKVLS